MAVVIDVAVTDVVVVVVAVGVVDDNVGVVEGSFKCLQDVMDNV